MDTENNQLSSMSCLHVNSQWFWKKDFPTSPVKDTGFIVNGNIIPFNKAFCNFEKWFQYYVEIITNSYTTGYLFPYALELRNACHLAD